MKAMKTFTKYQRDILSDFARFKKGGVIPYMKCKRNDPEIMELAEAGYVKIEHIDIDDVHYDEVSPIFGSLPTSCEIGEPHAGQVGKTIA